MGGASTEGQTNKTGSVSLRVKTTNTEATMFNDKIFDYITFKAKSKKNGLHDSGFRFIEVYGVTRTGKKGFKKILISNKADNIRLDGIVSIDVTEDGTQRIFSRKGKIYWDSYGPVNDNSWQPSDVDLKVVIE